MKTPHLSPDWFLRSRLKLRHLQLMIAIDEHRNLHRVAEKMNIAQPAASKLLAEVEAIFGQPLFERHARGLTPTIQGEILIRNGMIALQTLSQAAAEVNAFAKGQTGMVAAGTVMTPMLELLVDTVEELGREHPNLQITIEHNISDVLAPKLLEGGLDFALARIPPGMDPAPFEYREVGREEIRFLCRKNHPLAGKAVVRPEDLAEWPWVMEPRGSALRHKIEQIFLSAGLPMPKSIVNSTSTVMSLIMIDRSDAITAFEWNVAKFLADMGRIKMIRFTEQVFLEPYGMLSVKGKKLSPGAQIMYDTIMRRAKFDGAGAAPVRKRPRSTS